MFESRVCVADGMWEDVRDMQGLGGYICDLYNDALYVYLNL